MKRNHALAVQVKANVLKCDKPGCGFTTEIPGKLDRDTIPFFIGVPCPKCGASLLTREDARAMMIMLRIVAVLNFIYTPLVSIRYALHRMGLYRLPPDKLIKAQLNGTGTIKFSEPK